MPRLTAFVTDRGKFTPLVCVPQLLIPEPLYWVRNVCLNEDTFIPAVNVLGKLGMLKPRNSSKRGWFVILLSAYPVCFADTLFRKQGMDLAIYAIQEVSENDFMGTDERDRERERGMPPNMYRM
jgi:hypothetical protein